MDVEEKQKLNKQLHILEIKVLKILPFILAIICFINSILSGFNIDIPSLSYLAGMSFLPLIFMYLSSYAFKFCEYHRLPLHYILLNNIFSILGYEFNICFDTWLFIFIHMIIFGICTIITVYLKHEYEKKSRKIT